MHPYKQPHARKKARMQRQQRVAVPQPEAQEHIVTPKNKPHYHRNEKGLLVKCYHETKSQLRSISFWVGITISFPIEHFLYDHVPPFTWIAHLLGV